MNYAKKKTLIIFNSKTKKNYAKSTLISRLNKITSTTIEIETKTAIIEEEIVNIEYKMKSYGHYQMKIRKIMMNIKKLKIN